MEGYYPIRQRPTTEVVGMKMPNVDQPKFFENYVRREYIVTRECVSLVHGSKACD